MKLRFNVDKVILFVIFFAALLPGFNVSLHWLVTPGPTRYLPPLVVMGLSIWYVHRRSVLQETRSGRLPVMAALWVGLLAVKLWRNHDISSGNYMQMLYYIMCFMMTLLFTRRVRWIERVWPVVRVYAVFHLATGLILLFFRDFLLNRIVPLFYLSQSGQYLLREAISNGYMTGLTYHYSTMGMYMALGTVAFAPVLFERRKGHLRRWAMMAVMLLGLFMTGKRGPLVFTVMALGIVYILAERMYTRRGFMRIMKRVLLLLLFFVLSYLFVPQVRSLVNRFLTNLGDANSYTSGRMEYMWVYAVQQFFEHLFFGTGWRGFRYMIPTLAGINANDAHNIYLQVLAETGIFGAIITFGFFLYAWYAGYKAMRLQDKRGVLSPAQTNTVKISLSYQTFFLLYGISGNPLYDEQCFVPYFISCAVCFACYARLRTKRIGDGGVK